MVCFNLFINIKSEDLFELFGLIKLIFFYCLILSDILCNILIRLVFFISESVVLVRDKVVMDWFFFFLFVNGYGVFGWVCKVMLVGMFVVGVVNVEIVMIVVLGDSLV